MRVLGAAIAAGRVAVDDAAVERCGAALPAALEGCDWVTPGQPLPPAECRGLTRGRVAAGGVCRSSLECSEALHCEGGTPSEPGRCVAPLAEGMPCRAPSDNLASLLFARDLEQAHPSCVGSCSLVSHRCEKAVTSSLALAPTRAALPGESCRTDFDCERGGCTSAGVCGAKCAVTMLDAARLSALPKLALPRRAAAR